MKLRLTQFLFVVTAVLSGATGSIAQGSSQPMMVAGDTPQMHPLGLGVPSPAPALVDAPSIRATGLIQESGSTVILTGIVTAENAPAKFWFACGTNVRSLTSSAVKADVRAGTTTIAGKIGGLRPNTTYYFQLFASNAVGTSSSRIMKVVTGSFQASASPRSSSEFRSTPAPWTGLTGGAHVDQSSQRSSR